MSQWLEFAKEHTASAVKDLQDFYPHYLSEHQNIACRRLHFAGSAAALSLVAASIHTGKKRYALTGVLMGYSAAWAGHFVFEKNRPATFKDPLKSFLCDWIMFSDMARGRISLISAEKDHPSLKQIERIG